jgi:hypothetical protein
MLVAHHGTAPVIRLIRLTKFTAEIPPPLTQLGYEAPRHRACAAVILSPLRRAPLARLCAKGAKRRLITGIEAMRERDNAERLMWLNLGLLFAVSLVTLTGAVVL